MKRPLPINGAVPMFAVAMLPLIPAAAQDSTGWDLSWHSTDSGGGFSSAHTSGGEVTLVAVIGQADGGAARAQMSGGGWSLAGGYLPAQVRHCPADCDASGSLEFFDFLCFQNLFTAADPGADCDESGGLDFFDFLCFQNEFALGCP